MAERLTDALARRASAGNRPQKFFWDADVKGFALRVTNRGAKAFILDYRVAGRQRRITIGNYPDWTVIAARDVAKSMKRDVNLGQDPMGDRHSERVAPTISDLWDRYAIEHLVHKADRSQADERSMWAKLILPSLAKVKVKDLAHDQVAALHREITIDRGTPVRANRTIEVLRKALGMAVRWQWRPDNPATGIRRNAEDKRQHFLSTEELARVMRALADHPERVSANALKLLVLTGARRGEVLSARWDMFDLDKGVWTKPSAHTKQKKEHRVPLSAAAISMLKEIRQETTGSCVFPGKTPDAPITDIKRTWATICKTAGIERVRIHDLRHSFASLLVSNGASLPLIGAMLGHTQVATTARYAHLYDDPLRDAAEQVSAAIGTAG